MKKIYCSFMCIVECFLMFVSLSHAYSETSGSERFFVKNYVFEGNTVFSDWELSDAAAPYTGREIGYSELEELRYKLTMLYVDKGYINSGVIIPDQKMSESVLKMNVVEGRLSGVEISGNGWLRSRYIEKRIMPGAGSPLNMNELQERLQMIQADPLIETVNSELKAGASPGEAILKVKVEESNPWNIGSQFSNSYPPGSGENIFETWVSHADLTGLGDTLWLQAGYIQDLSDYSGYYFIPFTAYDSRLKLSYSKSSSSLIEEPFDKIDVESKSETYEIALSHPVIKTGSREFILGFAGAKRYSETSLMGQPFSFSEGVNNGKCDISVIRFSMDWISRDYAQAVSARSLFNLGISVFGSTDNPSSPDSQFFSWIGQFQWVRQIEQLLSSQMIFRTNMQVSASPLLPPEKFAIGGSSSVRGYRENQLVRDNGIVSSLEIRIPVMRLPLPCLSKTENDGRVYLAPFADYGRGWNTDRKTPDPWDVSSVGAGIRYEPSSFIYSSIYWGFPLRDVENPDNSLQDSGVHFMIGCRFI